MKVAVCGTGYVGLVSGTCLAEIGHDVTCLEINQEKLNLLKNGECPIYEPGLEDLLKRNIKANRLSFTDDFTTIKDAKCVFLAVQTPSSDSGEANLEYLMAAAKTVAENIGPDTIIVIKSTVPVGTAQKVQEVVAQNTQYDFDIVSNPEFLKEGSAVEDFMRPDRVIIGHRGGRAPIIMEELYAPLVRQGNPIYMMSNLSAEMAKYAANCFLATKISFINEIAKLCDATGADVNEVRKGMASDQRIGPHFLYPGPGYGGSCFPKDVKALIHTAKENGLNLELVEAAEEVNQKQREYLFRKIENHFNGDLGGKVIAFWGVAFKANTDDIRESSAITLAELLCAKGAHVQYFDPVASDNFSKVMEENSMTKSKTTRFDDKYECLNEADGLLIMTEWREFSFPNFSEIKDRLKSNVIFDGRNLYKTNKVLEEGFTYYAVGKRIDGQ